jgi:hypothetical protein
MRVQTRLVLDVTLLVALIAAYRPEWTGVSLHQWLSIAVIAPLLVHGVANWEWTARLIRTLFHKLLSMPRVNLVIDTALFLSAVIVMVSGFMVSPALLAPFGLHPGQPLLWHNIHGWTADATIAVLAVHAVAHWRWLWAAAVKLVGGLGSRQLATGPAVLPMSATAAIPVAQASRQRGASRVGSRGAQAASERAAAMRTLAVVGVTAIVGLAVLAGVPLASPLLPSPGQAIGRAADKAVMTCPSTGCTASKCHAEYNESASVFYASSGAKRKPRRKTPRLTSLMRVALAPAPATLEPKAATTLAAPIAAQPAAPVPTAKKAPAAAAPKRHATRVLACPQTGCTASSCHGTHGQSAAVYYRNH